MLKETNAKFDSIKLVCADAMYLSRDNCTYISSIGAVPRIYPKKNVALNAKGSFAWKHMLMDFVKDVQKWLRSYHNRSISETGNSVIKTRFSRPLLKRRDDRRDAEGCYKITGYNIRRLGYVHHMDDVEVKWLSGG